MYENNNTVSIDWKGLFIKLIIVALIIFAIFKGYEYFSNNNNNKNITSTNSASQLFNANLETLKQAGENYFDYSNFLNNYSFYFQCLLSFHCYYNNYYCYCYY